MVIGYFLLMRLIGGQEVCGLEYNQNELRHEKTGPGFPARSTLIGLYSL